MKISKARLMKVLKKNGLEDSIEEITGKPRKFRLERKLIGRIRIALLKHGVVTVKRIKGEMHCEIVNNKFVQIQPRRYFEYKNAKGRKKGLTPIEMVHDIVHGKRHNGVAPVK